MMDIIGMLTGLKDKVLDAAHYEILRAAYELQNDSIDQLKTNNEALRESNGLLRERATALETELKAVRHELLQAKLHAPVAPSDYKPKGVAQAILKCYQKSGKTTHYDTEFKREIKCSDIELSAAIRELRESKIIESPGGDSNGTSYRLERAGEQLIIRGID